jgi:hypothetical protein
MAGRSTVANGAICPSLIAVSQVVEVVDVEVEVQKV